MSILIIITNKNKAPKNKEGSISSTAMKTRRSNTPTVPPWKEAPLPDDLVPSLPPDWRPPTYSTQEAPASPPAASDEDARSLREEVKEAIIV